MSDYNDYDDEYEDSIKMSLLQAAQAECEAQIKRAEAVIHLYLDNPQGVADHSNILDEILSAAESGSSAAEKLKFIEDRWGRIK